MTIETKQIMLNTRIQRAEQDIWTDIFKHINANCQKKSVTGDSILRNSLAYTIIFPKKKGCGEGGEGRGAF